MISRQDFERAYRSTPSDLTIAGFENSKRLVAAYHVELVTPGLLVVGMMQADQRLRSIHSRLELLEKPGTSGPTLSGFLEAMYGRRTEDPPEEIKLASDSISAIKKGVSWARVLKDETVEPSHIWLGITILPRNYFQIFNLDPQSVQEELLRGHVTATFRLEALMALGTAQV